MTNDRKFQDWVRSRTFIDLNLRFKSNHSIPILGNIKQGKALLYRNDQLLDKSFSRQKTHFEEREFDHPFDHPGERIYYSVMSCSDGWMEMFGSATSPPNVTLNDPKTRELLFDWFKNLMKYNDPPIDGNIIVRDTHHRRNLVLATFYGSSYGTSDTYLEVWNGKLTLKEGFPKGLSQEYLS